MNYFATAVILPLAFAASNVLAEEGHKREIYGFGQIFQNIAAQHVVPLLRNQAWVRHWENGEGWLPDGGHVNVLWYDDNGLEYRCYQDSEKGGANDWNSKEYSGEYSGFSNHLKSHAVRYPLKKSEYVDGYGYTLLRYDGKTSDLTGFIFKKKRWWEAGVGHLQARIPAVTWEICPDFPSAKSLGTTVNTKQTSRFYFELLRQDQGRRTLHPEYVNEEAHEWLTKE